MNNSLIAKRGRDLRAARVEREKEFVWALEELDVERARSVLFEETDAVLRCAVKINAAAEVFASAREAIWDEFCTAVGPSAYVSSVRPDGKRGTFNLGGAR